MNASTVQSQIEQAAQSEHQWKPGDVNVQELAAIQMPPCAFFAASHKVIPTSFPANYAVLGDGQIVSDADPKAADKIFSACGAGAKPSAGSWAEVLARFHPQVMPGTVLYEKDKAPTAVSKLEAAGGKFAPPAFAPGKEGSELSFYLMNYESSRLYKVQATRKPDGSVEVKKAKAF
jgi:hypothetical protein